MRPRWPAALAVAALLAVAGCSADDTTSAPPITAGSPPQLAAMPDVAPRARLCDALPDAVVAAATGHPAVVGEGAAAQCSWRAAPPAGTGDVVLQGSFIEPGTFELGRDGATSVAGLGDDAYLVTGDPGAPTTLYVREGHVAFALWQADAPAPPGDALRRLAGVVLAG